MEALGLTLRRLRATAGLSLAVAALKSGVTKGYLSKIESGDATPSIAVLARLSDSYGVPMASLFDGESAASHLSLVRRDDRRAVNRDGTELGYVFESVSYRKRDARAQAFVVTMPAVASPLVLYRHRGEEIFFILEGKVRFWFGTAEYVLEPGDCLYFDSSIEHRGEAYGGKTARALAVILPTERASSSRTRTPRGTRRRRTSETPSRPTPTRKEKDSS